ncbi:MAG: transporter [Bryobacterales bacterium]|nr:transporter [Bryobacterales bacterium]
MGERGRWVPVWFLFTGGMINYMDRSAVSVAAPLLMRDLKLDAVQMGIIFSAFFAGYALFNFIGGYAADVLGPKRVFTVAMTVWSAFCGLTATATGFVSLLFVRVVFGFGEGPFAAAANKAVRNWFPREQIATAIGLANCGTPLGGAVAGPIVGWLALKCGWRASFIALGAIGLLWTLFWMIAVGDRRTISTRNGANNPTPKLWFYLKQPGVIATAIAFFAYSYILYFFLTWFPSYLTISGHLSIQDMAFVNTIPWLFGTVGLIASGLVCDLISRAIHDVLRARKLVLVISLAAAAVFVILSGLAATLAWAVTFMTSAVLFIYLTGAIYWALIHELVQSEYVGAAGGFVHLIANCAGIIGPAVTGFIVRGTGLFTGAFLLAGAVALAGAVSVAVLVPRSSSMISTR